MKQTKNDTFISQEDYAKEILKKFDMNICNLMSTPIECGVKLLRYEEGEKVDPIQFKSLVGSLYCLTSTRPDIVFGVGLLSCFMEATMVTHMMTTC